MPAFPTRFYIASCAPEPEGGVYLMESDESGSVFTTPRQVATLGKTLFVRSVPDRGLLLAAHDITGGNDERTGRICSYRIEPQTGDLTLLNCVKTEGTTPCHIEITPDHRFALAANFRGPGDVGSLSVIHIEADGKLGPASDRAEFEGESVHPTRQKCSHIHSSLAVPDSNDLYAADLGTDRIHHFKISSEGSLLHQVSAKVEPGLGPRHMALYPTGKYLYCVTEMGNTVLTFSRNGVTGALVEVDSVSTLPEEWTEGGAAADLHLSPAGQTLVASNRGHDSLAVYEVSPSDGSLGLQTSIPCGGENPRGFVLWKVWCIVANQSSDWVSVFKMDERENIHNENRQDLKIPAPVCLSPAPDKGEFLG